VDLQLADTDKNIVQ